MGRQSRIRVKRVEEGSSEIAEATGGVDTLRTWGVAPP